MAATQKDFRLLLVGLATYNEMENLPALVARIHVELPMANVLVVDDNSPDGTGRWCRDFAAKNSWFSCMVREGKLGLGSALALLMQTAIEQGATHLLTMDADWSHPPEQLPAMVAAAEHADVVIGSRYCEGGAIEGWPARRRLMSRVVNKASRIILGIPIGDFSGNYRVYSCRLLAEVSWDELRSDGYAFIEEVLWHLKAAGATFAEVPITFVDRMAGESKISWREMVGAGRMLGSLAWRRIRSE
ncbi:polyprenol monophosphomannose synthase [Bythopirellula polymerisocia]|uniref:Undecaprenyl-phosphate mannosyltransferase n=1 Tax=Bythopirellula polymerisocia TaxID=2528003 RepID=A0A5C6D0L6_9BACT|nr:polyprenol monophosphomannose synthase [Bythopirellula polymerisocia]TWU28429.1 Undecaprenyl-phosphate mannosyltransferase [Bythopirellula polymerisocia]